MIYLSKLAKRLAIAGRIAVGTAALLAACAVPDERDFLGPGNPNSPPTSLTLEPKIGTVRPGDMIQFSATARNALGEVVITEIDWTATGGYISPEGLFVSDRLGQFQVTAKLRKFTTVGDSAQISVFLNPSDVLKLSITPGVSDVTAGEGVQLEAIAELADGRTVRQPPLAWTATSGEVDGTGYYVAPEVEGTFSVNAIASTGVSAQASVRVKAGKRVLTRIEVAPTSVALQAGQARQFSATGYYDDGSTKVVPVLWSSTGGSISSDGLFTAGSTPGTFRVIGRFRQGGQADTAVVTVGEPQIVALTVSPDAVSMATQASQQFVATARLSDGSTRTVTPSWEATGGTITSAGLYTAGSTSGSFRIIASLAGPGVADTAAITISAPAVSLTGLIVNPSNVTVPAGTSRQFSVTGTWSDGSTRVPSVTWSATGGTISSAGLYQAGKTPGTYQVIARSAQWNKADTSVVVVSGPELVTLTVQPATVNLLPDQTRQFAVSGTWSDGSTKTPLVNWTADGGTITPAGLYTAGADPGTYLVVATHTSGKADTSLVTISPPAPTLLSLSLAPSTASLAPGGSIQFTASGTWSEGGSGVPSVTYTATGGTISASGLYTAGSTAGTFKVTAKHSGGTLTATATVTVTAAAPTLTTLTISPETASLPVGGSRQFSVSGVWSDGSSTTPAVTWSTTGGSITSSGAYEAPNSAGTYRVIAKQVGGTKADTATVSVTSTTTVVKLDISPQSSSLITGQSRQFSGTATYSNGGTGTPTIQWTASGGSVSSSGLYTAPSQAGTYRVFGQVSGSTVKDTATVTVAAPKVVALTLSPASATLLPGASQQFTTAATWSDGLSHPVTLSYSATGGSITTGGLYTAGTQAGNYRVIVTCSGCSLADTSSIAIQTSSTSGVTSLTLTPETITLDIGEVYPFTVTARLANGSTVTNPVLNWTASSGEVNSQGWYRAPRTAGTYTVTVSSGSVNDKATVTVKVPTGPYFTDNFNSCTLSKAANSQGFFWWDTQGGNSTEVPAISSTMGRSGCSLKFSFTAGVAGDDAWSEQRFGFGKRLSEVYMQWYQYWPVGSEWPNLGPKFVHREDTGPDNNKFLRFWDEDYAKYRIKLGFSTLPRGGGDSNIITEYGTNGGGVGPFGSAFDPNGITSTRRGRWVRIQIHVRLATAANNNGVIEMWVDGVKTINNTNLPMYPDGGLGNYLRRGYILGWANSGFSQTSMTYIDDVVISGVPIP
jgi:hypothetical protein